MTTRPQRRRQVSPADRAEMVRLYRDEGLTVLAIAARTRRADTTVYRCLKQAGALPQSTATPRITAKEKGRFLQLHRQGHSVDGIAYLTGRSHPSIRKYLKSRGVSIRSAAEVLTGLSDRQRAERNERIMEARARGLSVRAIAKEFHLCPAQVDRLLHARGVRARLRPEPIPPALVKKMARLYRRQKLNPREIGERFGYPGGRVRNALAKAGVRMRSASKAQALARKKAGT